MFKLQKTYLRITQIKEQHKEIEQHQEVQDILFKRADQKIEILEMHSRIHNFHFRGVPEKFGKIYQLPEDVAVFATIAEIDKRGFSSQYVRELFSYLMFC